MSAAVGWTPGEVPPPDDLTADWWDATRDHRLTVQTCRHCRHAQHPPRAVCTACGRTDALASLDASGRGVVDTWTVVHRAPRPEVPTPYTIARVRLEEGPILLTRLERCADPRLELPVTVHWVDLPDGRALPSFRPIDRDETDRTTDPYREA